MTTKQTRQKKGMRIRRGRTLRNEVKEAKGLLDIAFKGRPLQYKRQPPIKPKKLLPGPPANLRKRMKKTA